MRRGLIAVFGLAIVVAMFVHASEEDAEYRHKVMEAIGGHFSAIVKIVRGDVRREEHLSTHVDALAGMAAFTQDLFPEGSEGGESLPTIWEEPEAFAEKVTAFQEAAASLKSVFDSGDMDAFRSAVFGVGRTCKGCHDDYRE